MPLVRNRDFNGADLPFLNFDSSEQHAPWDFYGGVAPAAIEPWTSVEIGSRYFDVVGKAWYVKVADTKAAGDWEKITTDTEVSSLAESIANIQAGIARISTITVSQVLNDIVAEQTQADLYFDVSGTLMQWTMLADQTGSIVVDILKGNYTNYPPVASICGGFKPQISNGVKAQDVTHFAALEPWSDTRVAPNDVLRFSVVSCTNITRVTLALTIELDLEEE